MKSYTDLEQSKKLAEILPVESADMVLPFMHTKNNEYVPGCVVSRNYIEAYNEMMTKLPGMEKKDVCKLIQPVWSLAALLSILPQPHLERFDKGTWICSVFNKDNHFIDNASKNDPVDVCCEMIIKLHEEFKTALSWVAQEQTKRS